MRTRRCIPLALVLSLVTLLAGCALPWQQARGPQPLPDAGQVLHPLDVGPKNGDLDSLDSALLEFNSDYQKAQLIFPPLVTLDDQNRVAPWGADRWETSSDGLTWTFHLHSGMKWSDGTPIDANTYAYSLNRSLDPCTASGVGYYLSGQTAAGELIKGAYAFNNGTCPQGQLVSTQTLIGMSILAVNPLTFQLTLSHPAAYFPVSLTYATAWAQPKQLIEEYGPPVWDPTTNSVQGWTAHLEGFGGNLFTVKHWGHTGSSPGMVGHFDLVRNEHFWGKKPTLREIDWTLYKDVDTLWSDFAGGAFAGGSPEGGDFTSGTGDYAPSPPLAQLDRAKSLPGYHEDPDLTISYLTPNWNVPPFDDVRVRQAFDLALDRQANGLLPTYASTRPSIHMVPDGMPGYNPALHDPDGRVGDAALSPDVAKAGALWKAYLDDKWGGDASKAPKVTFLIRAGSATALTNATAYQRQWQAAMPGLQVVVQPAERFSGFPHRASLLQLATAGWVMDYPDPQDFLSLLARSGTWYNQTGINLFSADALMDKADVNPDPAQRLHEYQQAEQELVDAVAWIPTGQALNQYVVRARVAGGYHERASETAALAVWQRIFITD